MEDPWHEFPQAPDEKEVTKFPTSQSSKMNSASRERISESNYPLD